LQNPSNIRIIYNAEISPVPCCRQFCHFLHCKCYDHNRSYLYLRENSIETNESTNECCSACLLHNLLHTISCPVQCVVDTLRCLSCDCAPRCSAMRFFMTIIPCLRPAEDNVNVVYFDRGYLRATDEGLCCVQHNMPKLEVRELGCMFCCMQCPPLMNIFCPCAADAPKEVVIMPYESDMCCFCCDCPNRAMCCHNCCGLCGPVTGSPLVYETFHPQPKNVDAFVAVAQPVVFSRQFKQRPAPAATVMMVAMAPPPPSQQYQQVQQQQQQQQLFYQDAPPPGPTMTIQTNYQPHQQHQQHAPAPAPAPAPAQAYPPPHYQPQRYVSSPAAAYPPPPPPRLPQTSSEEFPKAPEPPAPPAPEPPKPQASSKPPPPPPAPPVVVAVAAAPPPAPPRAPSPAAHPVGNAKMTKREFTTVLEKRRQETSNPGASVPQGGVTQEEMEWVLGQRAESATNKHD